MAITGISNANQMPKMNPAKNNVAFNGVMDKMVSSKAFESIAKFAGENSAVFNAASALAINTILRPATIMALPGKGEDSKKNKLNAAAHSISSGIMGFVITSIAMKPIQAGLKKVMSDTPKYLPKLADKMKENPQTAAAVNKMLSFGPDIILAVPRALLTSKATGVIKKYVFGIGKEKKADKVQQQVAQQTQQPVQQTQQTERPVLDGFKGGRK